MKKALIGFCLFFSSFLLNASESNNSYVCSDSEMEDFETFLAGNRATFDKEREELYSPDDPCANILKIELVALIDSVSNDVERKNSMCGVALNFCKNNSDADKAYEELYKIVVIDCSKGTRFVVTREECEKYKLL